MAKSKAELEKAWAKVIAKAWTDERFKEKLLKNPEQTLREMGIEFPKGQKIEMHEESSKVVHLILPSKPKKEMSESELKSAAAGATTINCQSYCEEVSPRPPRI